MTLQYRIRSKYEDQRWWHRAQLCAEFLLSSIDRWCRSDAEFPIQPVIAGMLYLYSPRSDPDQFSQHGLCAQLSEIVRMPQAEYRLTWPGREEAHGEALIVALTKILAEAVQSWTDRGIEDPSSETVAKRVIEEMMEQQYVVFHHYQTTRRDLNPWGI
jgi:hypothetical protein